MEAWVCRARSNEAADRGSGDNMAMELGCRSAQQTGWQRYPMNPEYGQQIALVHWIPKGLEPDDWAQFFIRPDHDRLLGILVKKKGAERDPRFAPE